MPGTLLAPSWEVSVLHRYASDILRDEATYETELSAERGVDQDMLDALEELDPAVRKILQIGVEVKDRLMGDLEHIWEDADDEARQELAEVVLALATQLNPTVFNEALEKQPELAGYFTDMITLAANHHDEPFSEARPKLDNANTSVAELPASGESTHNAWHERIQTELDALKAQPADAERRGRLLQSVNAYQAWAQSQGSREQAEAHLEAITSKLLRVFDSCAGEEALLPVDGDEREVFRIHWLLWSVDKTLAEQARTEIIKRIIERWSSIHSHRDAVVAARQALAEVKAEEAILDTKEDGGGLAARRVSRKKTAAAKAVADAELDYMGAEEALIETILPEGVALDDLGGSLDALKKDRSYIGQLEHWPDEGVAQVLAELSEWLEANVENLLEGKADSGAEHALPDEAIEADGDGLTAGRSVDEEEQTEHESSDSPSLRNPEESAVNDEDEESDDRGDEAPLEEKTSEESAGVTEIEGETGEKAAPADSQPKATPESHEKDEVLPSDQLKQAPAVVSARTVAIHAASEEGRRCIEALEKDVYIPAVALNAALVRLIAEHQLPTAAQLAYAVDQRGLSEKCLPLVLLKSAYYGMSTYDDRGVFNKARRQLLAIGKVALDEWLLQPHGDIAPYLLFLATFQPALFGGNTSTAILLLGEVPEGIYDTHTRTLIRDIIDIANRGEQATLSMLRTGGQADHVATTQFDIRQLEQWVQKIREARRGYAPVLKAQAYCLDRGEFKVIADIIKSNDRQQHQRIQSFITQYQDQEASNQLLMEMLRRLDMDAGPNVTRIGKQRFHHKVTDLVHIAKDWLESAPRNKGSVLEDFCTRFGTRLTQSIEHFKAEAADKAGSMPRRAGASLVAERLRVLHKMIIGEMQPWSYRRVKGWYYHPRDIAAQVLPKAGESSPEVIRWLLEGIGTQLCTRETIQLALERGRISLAELLRLRLEELGEEVGGFDTDARFHDIKRNLSFWCVDLEAKLEDAMLAGLVDSARAELFSGQLSDTGEAVEQLEMLDDVNDIQSQLEAIDTELQERTANMKQELKERYNKGMLRLESAVPDTPVPDEWVYELESAFDDDNISVVMEMLDELDRAVDENRRIDMVKMKDVPVLDAFLKIQHRIFQGLENAIEQDKRNVWHGVTDGGEAYGLHFEQSGSNSLKRAVDAMIHWSGGKPQPSMDKRLYDRVCAVLDMLGIVVEERLYHGGLNARISYKTATGFSSLKMPVRDSGSTRPFTLFGSRKRGGGTLPIMIAHQPWEPANLEELIVSHGVHDEALLISAVPLTGQQRDKFAQYFKVQQRTVLHIDLVSLLFLAAQVRDSVENIPIRNFLWLSAPFTYFNPYGGDTLQPPLPEMIYGRERQITRLPRLENGAAIVFGGRQLGKSTILQEVQRRFDKPAEHKYAFYEMLDKDLHQRMDISKEAHDKARQTIWGFMYRNLQRIGMIDNPKVTPSIDYMTQEVKQTLIDNKNSAFIVIFDEIDPILNVDSHYDFSIFRGLRDLVVHREVNGRFKVIIGGLENVKRFENSPNYPLTQMGGTTLVEIMPSQEALHLVMEPMKAAGYRFENTRVANRVLAITNRHPGLIQTFCHELVDYLSNNRQSRVGQGVITGEDVESVGRTPKVLELIRNRFDMTLNLDYRYLVIIYGIIADGQGAHPFTTEYAKGIAEVWLPKAFGQLSHRQFEAFLDELVGLGVLRKNSDGRFALRNTNVLKLLTDVQADDIGHQLERAIKNYKNYDPMDRHAYDPDRHKSPSPITYRDEKAIIGISFEATSDAAEPLASEINHKVYTTTLVVGSRAQGIDGLSETLPSIYEEERILRPGRDSGPREYQTVEVSTDDYPTPQAFESKLLEPLLSKKARRAPQMVFVTVSLDTPLPFLLGMIDAAHEHGLVNDDAIFSVRILFLMGPEVYWKWLVFPDKTRGREGLQPFVKLGYWSVGAVQALLGKLRMNDSSTAVDETMALSQGWFHSLKIIASKKSNHAQWADLRQFKGLVPLTELKRKDASKWLELCGVNAVEWAKPLLLTLMEQAGDEFDRDVIELCADEAGLRVDTGTPIESMVRWLVDMGLLVAQRHADSHTGHYIIAPSIKHALSICREHETA